MLKQVINRLFPKKAYFYVIRQNRLGDQDYLLDLDRGISDLVLIESYDLEYAKSWANYLGIELNEDSNIETSWDMIYEDTKTDDPLSFARSSFLESKTVCIHYLDGTLLILEVE